MAQIREPDLKTVRKNWEIRNDAWYYYSANRRVHFPRIGVFEGHFVVFLNLNALTLDGVYDPYRGVYSIVYDN